MERVDQLYSALKQKLMDLEVDPTQPIDERALVRETGGSLTLVTQVLGRLADEGLVLKQRQRWHVSRGATASIMREVFEVRLSMEGLCARLAAERITPEQVARMEQVHRDFEQVIKEGDNKALIAVDRKFHQSLYEASGNRFLARSLNETYTLIYRLVYFALDRMSSVRGNVQEHREILDALRSGDGRSAERAIQQHITRFQRMVDELL